MMSLPTRSPIAIEVQQNGGVSVSGPDGSHAASVDVVQESGPVRDWLKDLCLPKDWDVLDRLRARHRIFDASRSLRPGRWSREPVLASGVRLQPQHWTLRPVRSTAHAVPPLDSS